MAERRNEILEVAWRSDVGLIRPHNEDSVAVDTELGLIVLADGMGGYQAGEVASGITTDLIIREIRAGAAKFVNLPPGASVPPPGAIGAASAQSRLLQRAIENSNSAILEAGTKQKNLSGMGSTVVALFFWSDRVSIAHVGDSRVYRWRGGLLQRLTRDHSLVQELVDHGFYTPEQARTAPNRHLVTRALGMDAAVRVEISETIVEPTDYFLLCSDGLTDMLTDEDISIVLKNLANNLEQIASYLVDLANQQGGRDNISVILARTRTENSRSWRSRLQNWINGSGKNKSPN